MENKLSKISGRLFPPIAFLMSLYHLWQVLLPSMDPTLHMDIHLGFALVLVFLSAMTIKESQNPRRALASQILSLLFLILSLVSTVYIYINFGSLVNRVGRYTAADTIIGIIMILTILEATRRTYGWILPSLVVIALLYGHYGKMFSGLLHHSGYSWPRLIASVTTYLYGVFGTVLNVSATYIVLFMIFGGLLDASGAGQFFINIAIALGGKTRSGAAQAAVIGSGLVGSINGSAVANVASTGTFTIPMMKDRGYEPHYAGAIEAVASTGGMIMPPVMGVGAFIMSGIIGVPYAKIALCAMVPALLYYLTTSMSVHLRALHNGFEPLPDEMIPDKKKLIREDGIFFLPLLAIIVLLMIGTSVMRSAFLGCVVLVGCYLIKHSLHNPRFILSKQFWQFLYDGLVSGAKSAMTVAAACAAMGIVTQIFVMTGLAMNIVFYIKTLSGSVGIIALILTMAVTILFGMGVPTTAAYVLVATLAGSVLSELGFNKIGIHLFVYYFAALANITPPVASAALVASKIAKSDYFKTAVTATRLGLPGFIMPFMFVYHPELLLMGSFLDIAAIIISCVVGLFCMCAFFEGYIFRKLNLIERLLMLVCAVFGIWPGALTDIICYIIFAVVVGRQYLQKKKSAAIKPA
ncbi:MAG TPA: TRAP transporter permease [Clostridia bacterium]|nr:TRAP transporter permease [Clostridia bacterium]